MRLQVWTVVSGITSIYIYPSGAAKIARPEVMTAYSPTYRYALPPSLCKLLGAELKPPPLLPIKKVYASVYTYAHMYCHQNSFAAGAPSPPIPRSSSERGGIQIHKSECRVSSGTKK